MRRVALRVLQFGLAIGLIAVLVRSGLLDLRQLGSIGERWPWLLVAQGIFVLFLFFATTRWYLLMRARGIPTPYRDTAALLLIGWLFNQTMPSSTGGDVAKAVAIALEHPERRSGAVISIAVDRFIGLVALLAVALAGAALNASLIRSSLGLSSYVATIGAAFAAVLTGAALFFAPPLRALVARTASALIARLPTGSSLVARASLRVVDLIRTVDQAVYAYRSHPGTVAACFLLSVGLHATTICLNLCLTWTLLGTPFDWVALIALVPLAHTGMAIGLTPGAVGVAEGIYAWLFGFVGIAQGSTVCVLQRLIWYSWALVGAAVFVLRRRRPRAEAMPLAPTRIASGAERSR
jgi:glycosyltransferase 2 family protein